MADGQVQRLCLDLRFRFQWPGDVRRYRVVQRWSSRTSDFFLCAPERAGTPVVLKVLSRERDADPRGCFEILQALEQMYRGIPAEAARPPRALGWIGEPPTIAMEYVSGRDGRESVRNLLLTGDEVGLSSLVRSATAVLGAWHSWWGVTWSEGSGDESRRRLARLARRQGVRLGRMVPPTARMPLVRRFRDFGVYNLRIADDGDIVILDPPPPASRDVDSAARDVAWFLASIAGAVVASGTVPKRSRAGLLRTYRDSRADIRTWAFEGYAAGAGRHLTESELRVTSLLEASLLAARASRARHRDVQAAAFLGRLALGSRWRAVHP